MNKAIIRSCIGSLLSLLILNGCSDRCERVNGPRERFEIPLGQVNTLEVNTPAQVEVRSRQDTLDGFMEVYAQPEIYQALNSRFRDRALRFNLEACFRGQEALLMDARLAQVRELRLNAAGEIRSSDLLEEDSIKIVNQGLGDVVLHVSSKQIESRSSASGNVILSGETNQLVATIAGSGELSGFDLFADTVIIENLGSGVVEVYADKLLQVNFIEETTVRYKGNPAVITVGGNGNLENANLGI